MAAVTPYVSWLSSTSAQAEDTANQARAAVSAYEAALAIHCCVLYWFRCVPLPISVGNRPAEVCGA